MSFPCLEYYSVHEWCGHAMTKVSQLMQKTHALCLKNGSCVKTYDDITSILRKRKIRGK